MGAEEADGEQKAEVREEEEKGAVGEGREGEGSLGQRRE